MTDFTKCNKISGTYYSTDNIEEFKFIVKLKEINKTIPVLKFESPVEDLEDRFETEDVGYYEEKVFEWQEKISIQKGEDRFSHNSNDDESIQDDDSERPISKSEICKIVSYINEDNYTNEDKISTDVHKISDRMKALHIRLHNENADKNGFEINENYFKNKSESRFVEKCIKMYIVADMNDYKRDPDLLLNREHVLFTILWNPEMKSLTVTPDFNDLLYNPYTLEINYDSKQLFYYSIEQLTVPIDEAKLCELSICNRIFQFQDDIRMRKMFQTFQFPPKRILKCVIIFEILTAESFEEKNLYVEYTVELPYGFETKDPLRGATQLSYVRKNENVANFSHLFEMSIDYHMNNEENEFLTKFPQIYFEIISCDMWGRRRTEGYCWMHIPLTQPGYRNCTLTALRPQGSNKRLWEMNRFFIGGCHLLKDITWISTPSTFQGNCLIKYGMTCVSTGKLNVASTVIMQSQSFAAYDKTSGDKHAVERLNVDSLFKSVNTVLSAYKTAKDKLKACLDDVNN